MKEYKALIALTVVTLGIVGFIYRNSINPWLRKTFFPHSGIRGYEDRNPPEKRIADLGFAIGKQVLVVGYLIDQKRPIMQLVDDYLLEKNYPRKGEQDCFILIEAEQFTPHLKKCYIVEYLQIQGEKKITLLRQALRSK